MCYERPDLIVISANSDAYILTPWIKQRFPEIAIVDILHNEYNEHVDWFSVAAEYSFHLDRRAVISEHWKSVLVENHHEAANKVTVLKNSVDTEKFDPRLFDRGVERKNLNIPQNAIVVGFIGRLCDQKNPHVFVELANQLKGDSRYYFLMAGNGELKDEVSDQLTTSANTLMLGYTEDVPRTLSVVDVLICPSKFEGFPLIGLEAASMGVSVIASDVEGFRDQIINGGFGRLYTSTDDVRADASIVASLLRNEEPFLLSAGSSGREYATTHYSSKLLKNQYRIFTDKLINRKSDSERKVILHIGAQKLEPPFYRDSVTITERYSLSNPYSTPTIPLELLTMGSFQFF